MWITSNVQYIKEYHKYVPKGPDKEFWCSDKIEHIRRLATTGRPWKIFRRTIHVYRILDRIKFRGFENEIDVEDVPESEYRDIDLTHIIKMRTIPDFEDPEEEPVDAIVLEAPIYFGACLSIILNIYSVIIHFLIGFCKVTLILQCRPTLFQNGF